jgi:hypothetical protein
MTDATWELDTATTVFNIPAPNMKKFNAQIEKLSRKVEKLTGEKIAPVPFSYETRKLADGEMYKVYQVLLTAPVAKLEGWSFLARLDHSQETGTIIRMVPNTGAELSQFRDASARTCDHCGINRYRRDTFIVRHEISGEIKQVGSTCLKDFFGHDPAKIAKLAELLGYAAELSRASEDFEPGQAHFNDYRYYDVVDFCARSAAAVRRFGWVSAKVAKEDDTKTATKSMAWSMIGDDVTEDDHAMAEEALEWARGLRAKGDNMSDYEHSISVIAEAVVMEGRHAGLAASIVGVHHMNKLRAAPQVQSADIGDFSGVINLFAVAAQNLKYPKIRLVTPEGQHLVLSVAGPQASQPGTVNVTDGGKHFDTRKWFGRVSPAGRWEPSKKFGAETAASVGAMMAALALDPDKVASDYGRLTGQCCYCSKGLDDSRSVEVGYGPVCAKNFGRPWGKAKKVATVA